LHSKQWLLLQKYFPDCAKYSHDIILGTPFLAQIYPFYVNESSVHTKILDKQISFNFFSAAKQREVALFKNSSINKQINLLQLKQNQVSYLQEGISHKRINHKLFLSSLNCISDFFPHLRQLCAPLYKRLGKNPELWSNIHTDIVRQFKQKVESLPYLGIPHPFAFMIAETDALEIGYGGMLR